ncbi:murein biosynthesis integral membrane protein MurJ [Virgibacillus phasianinus]|uniref:Probable lipid II flippase MurJ n=1 Tax=Virgibacillus phasianinus TaxID=2017483 RepID=A0A220U1P6_9BACI|nr:murein biosynthesis integral membrane protein MurJ [Virgibacillus phasianinus]ASK62164.1 murein biosynthesis integral membrane protein MurJ [Virgibacillus phasianinus]
MNKMIKAFGILTVLSIVGKILGFLREALIAAYFGTTGTADAYFVASIIPIVLFTAIGTSIQAGIIPIYMKDKSRSLQAANEKLHALGSFFIWVGLGLSVLTFLFAEPIIRIMAPGFTLDQTNQAILLTRILAPSLLLLTLTGISTGLMHANKQFVIPSLSPVVQNSIIILAIIFLTKVYGIVGVAIGVVLGTFIQTFVQYPALRKIGFKFAFQINRKLIKTTLSLFIPVILAAIVMQLNDVVDRIVTSFLETGSVAAINYANRLLWLPLSIMLMPVVTIFYPTLVEKATDNMETFLKMLRKGVLIIFIFAIPFECVMLTEGKNLVEMAYGRGVFDIRSLQLTVQAFLFFSIALPFFALRDFFLNALYAVHQFKVAFYSCLIGLCVNTILSIYLSSFMDIAGVALATSISMVVTVMFMLLKVRSIYAFSIKHGLILFGKLLTIFIVIMGVTQLLDPFLRHNNPWIEVIYTTVIVFVLYGTLLYLWKIPVWKKIKS